MDSIFQQISRSPRADQWHRFRCSAERFANLCRAVRALGANVHALSLDDAASPLTILQDAGGLLCAAESSDRSPSPFRQFADPLSVAFTNDEESAREFGKWTGYGLERTSSAEGSNSASAVGTLLQEFERSAWLDLESFVLRSVQAFNQLDLEGESLFLNLTGLVQDLAAPQLFELDMPDAAEFWPGRDTHWRWTHAAQPEYEIPTVLTARLQRLLYRRERVLFVEDLASAPDIQFERGSGKPFRSAFLLPLSVGASALGIMRLLFTRLLSPLPGEVEALEVVRRELSLQLHRTRTRLRMQRMATVDGLTNLFNHRFFREWLRTEFQRAVRYQKTMALIMIDIDDFKGYNDRYGHLAGDHVLAETARAIRGVVRDIDFVARYGGEEFALILPEVDAQSGLIVAEKIRRAVEALRFISEDGEAIGSITVSCGVTDNHDAATPDVLIERADRALYWVKRHGRNLVRLACGNDHA